jgi:hypothetical protein
VTAEEHEESTTSKTAGPRVDRYGWHVNAGASLTPKELAQLQRESAKEREREVKWLAMLGPDRPGSTHFKTFCKTHRPVFERRVMKGIPDSMRSRAWLLILDKAWETHPKRPTVTHYFKKGVPPCDQVIHADIPRTMPHVEMFSLLSVRESLYRVLRAYSNADTELGYYQGMAFPAAMLLSYMPETHAFWAFYHLMNGKGHKMRTYYVHDFVNLKQFNKVWDLLILAKYKAIHANLHKLDIDPMIYTPSWFLTAFLNIGFPPVFRLRAFDRVVTFGTRALLSLGLAVVSLLKKELMGPDMEVIIPLLQNPCNGARLKDWRQIIIKWDKVFLTKAEVSKCFQKAKVKEFV